MLHTSNFIFRFPLNEHACVQSFTVVLKLLVLSTCFLKTVSVKGIRWIYYAYVVFSFFVNIFEHYFWTLCTYVCMYGRTDGRTHAHSAVQCSALQCNAMHACMYVCMSAFMYVCLYVSLSVCLSLYLCVPVAVSL